MSDNDQLELLGQGTYGCAFYPEINCQTHHIAKSNDARQFLSKIQFQDESLAREVEVGKRIVKRVPNYRYFFAPIVSSCNVALSQLRQNKIKQCGVLNRNLDPQGVVVVSSKVPYLGKQTLEKYFSSLFDKRVCVVHRDKCKSMTTIYLNRLINTYLYLLSAFVKLNGELGIVHLDVKADNIMYDAKNKVPVIIDFGMSYCVADWLQYPKYLEIKHPFGVESFSYSPWCLEVSLLTHLARQVRRKNAQNRLGGYADEQIFLGAVPTTLRETYMGLCREFVDKNLSVTIFTAEERQRALSQWQAWVTALLRQKTVAACWTALLASYQTWDLYAVAMMYLYEMEDSGVMEQQDATTSAFVNHLKGVILANPPQRPRAAQMSNDARKLFVRVPATVTGLRPAVVEKAQRAVQQQPKQK